MIFLQLIVRETQPVTIGFWREHLFVIFVIIKS